MKIFLEKLVFKNRAPFESKFFLNFQENEIAVLSGINGKGKTTILSHIADAVYEIAKNHYSDVAEDKNSYYRISSGVFNSNQNEPSFVYFRFKIIDAENDSPLIIDYVDIDRVCTKEQYDSVIDFDGKIDFDSHIKTFLSTNKSIKFISSNLTQEIAEKVFNSNVVTYFPSYRFEIPGYLNDPRKRKLDYSKTMRMRGNLNKPLEVVSGLENLANWILDLVLDAEIYKDETRILKHNLERILTNILISKGYGPVHFAVGQRNFGSTRIQIVQSSEQKSVYPNIFNLSSGETSLLCLFGEILRQADIDKLNIELEQIKGIVLVDEIDKHLHIKLQKEILPSLLRIFPNVQFIISSHSPFLSMGLAAQEIERSKIKDLDTGLDLIPADDSQYEEVYQMMLGENQKFKEMYNALNTSIKDGTLPLVITEGKTDILHIKKAKEKLDLVIPNIEFSNLPISEEGWGAENLKNALLILAKDKQPRKIIGIFDRDISNIIIDIEKKGQTFKNYGNNVYAFCISKPESRTFDEICIEHYFTDEQIKKENTDGRRLFLGTEFYSISGKSTDGNFNTTLKNKAGKNTIIDEKVYKSTDLQNVNSIALSKNDFADLVSLDNNFIKDFNFENFRMIFNKILEIEKI